MSNNKELEKELRKKVVDAAKEYYHVAHGKKKSFAAGDRINYAGRCFDEKEIANLVESSLDFWLTEGRFSEEFAGKIADFLDVENVILTNSGSSANLLAFSALTSQKLGDKRLKQGDEVISVAAGFPATVTPIIQYGLVPVFVDVEIPTYNIDIEMMKRAITDKTKCIFIAHTLGNPFNVDEILKLAKENDLWVIEDNCIDGDRCSVVRLDDHIDVMTIKEIYDVFHRGDYRTFEILSHGDVVAERDMWNPSVEFMNVLSKRQINIISLYKQYNGDIKKITKKLGISRSSYYCSVYEIRKKQREFAGVRYKWSVVNNVLIKGVKDVKKITQNFGQTCVTDDHRIMVLDDNNISEENVNAFKKSKKTFINLLLSNNKKEKDVDLIKYLNGYKQENGCIKYDKKWIWFEYNKKCWRGKMQVLPKIKRFYCEADLEKICALFGFYCSEGNCAHELRFASTDIREIEMVARYIRAISNLKTIRISKQDGRDIKRVIRRQEFQSKKVIYSANLGHELFCIIFGELGGRGSLNKKVPTFVFNLDPKYIKIFYNYLIKGDGCRKSGDEMDFVVTTASLRLASGINLLNNLVYKKFSRYILSKNKYYDVSPVKSLKYIKKKICKIENRKNAKVYDIVVDGTSTFVDACGNVLLHNCDAFGSKYKNKYTGTFGHISTMSFYPAHHITTGEGGAVVTRDDELAKIIRSFRDWGRECYCACGENNTCGKRFTQQFGTLPVGYDHKYVYSELGYNLKMTDMQASIGCAQMDKLPAFCEKRKQNFSKYQGIFSDYAQYFILPEATKDSEPAWFSYIVSVKNDAPFKRNDLVKYLNENGIETRNIFAGNIVRQPGFMNSKYRIADHLNNTDFIMNNTFFLGTYPGLTNEMIGHIGKVVGNFVASVL